MRSPFAVSRKVRASCGESGAISFRRTVTASVRATGLVAITSHLTALFNAARNTARIYATVLALNAGADADWRWLGAGCGWLGCGRRLRRKVTISRVVNFVS